MKISVVIPTYERADILKLTLESLSRQILNGKPFPKEEFEVIVVDDGSKDGGATKKVVEGFENKNIGGKESNMEGGIEEKEASNFYYIWQENARQGAARNNGIKHAKGDIVLFIGDDIIPAREDFLEQHLKLHEGTGNQEKGSGASIEIGTETGADISTRVKNPIAVLGFTDWHPELKENNQLTPFMEWLTNGSCVLGRYGGHQFAYEKLEKGRRDGKKEEKRKNEKSKNKMGEEMKYKKYADYNFFYTSNISLPRELLLKEPFDTEFSAYGWEDIELGYRLQQKHDLKILYNPEAVGWHHHVITEESLAPRMRMIASSAYVINEKYPELKKIPSKKKILAFKALSNPITLQLLKLMSKMDKKWLNYYYYGLSKKYYLEGLK